MNMDENNSSVPAKQINLKFGLNNPSELGSLYDKGAIKGMHKIGTSRNSFATHQPDRKGHVNHVSKNESSSFKQLLLPAIAPR